MPMNGCLACDKTTAGCNLHQRPVQMIGTAVPCGHDAEIASLREKLADMTNARDYEKAAHAESVKTLQTRAEAAEAKLEDKAKLGWVKAEHFVEMQAKLAQAERERALASANEAGALDLNVAILKERDEALARVKQLEDHNGCYRQLSDMKNEAKMNASMLAKQTDLARASEASAAAMRAKVEKALSHWGHKPAEMSPGIAKLLQEAVASDAGAKVLAVVEAARNCSGAEGDCRFCSPAIEAWDASAKKAGPTQHGCGSRDCNSNEDCACPCEWCQGKKAG